MEKKSGVIMSSIVDEEGHLRSGSKLSQNLLDLQPSLGIEVFVRASALQSEGKDVLFMNMGNPHVGGQCPLTHVRMVLALCDLPAECGVEHPMASSMFPADVLQVAKRHRAAIEPGGTGAYTHPQGVVYVRERVASFIEARDGHPSNPDDIFLLNGASSGAQLCLTALISSSKDTLMTPFYLYPLYSSLLTLLGGSRIDYDLDEEQGWTITEDSLEDSFKKSIAKGMIVKALLIINPGNPTGSIFDRKTLEIVCRFCAKNKIVLLSDEVYQNNVYSKHKEFISAKKVCCETAGCQELELISFHSTSKGLLGECGRRGGYMELWNMRASFQRQVFKLVMETMMCPNIAGQIMTSLMVQPPEELQESYCQFNFEVSRICNSLTQWSYSLVAGLNAIPGISCQSVEGALYAFPSVQLPTQVIDAARASGQSPDTFYCLSLLEETGICVVPASCFGQDCNRFGFRVAFLLPDDKIDFVIEGFARHHRKICNKHIGKPEVFHPGRLGHKCVPVFDEAKGDSEFMNQPKYSCQALLPMVNIKCLDHYTLICDNAKAVADFHIQTLGFKVLRKIDVNTGTVDAGEFDMKNIVLQPPGGQCITLVVTEGLNDDTIFRKYMKKYGPGVHHVAFRVDDIDEAFETVKASGIKTTSDCVTSDMLSGLKQFFIDPCHSGFFIELIERLDDLDGSTTEEKSDLRRELAFSQNTTDHSTYSQSNMADLSNSLHSFLTQDEDKNLNKTVGYESCLNKLDFPNAEHIGPIQLFGFRVENVQESLQFLLDTFNFRFVHHDVKAHRIYLSLCGAMDDILFFVESARSQADERQAIVHFTISEVELQQFYRSTDPHMLPSRCLTYCAYLCSEQSISTISQVVQVPNFYELSVEINASRKTVMNFLLVPSNLSKWTGHKAIHFSVRRNQWVETRVNENGEFKDFTLCVEQKGADRLQISWPERGLSVCFVLVSNFGNSMSSTELKAYLPQDVGERQLSQLRRVIRNEMNILKAILEGHSEQIWVPDHVFWNIQLEHLRIYERGSINGLRAIPDVVTILNSYGFRGNIITEGDLYQLMSTDFALTVRTAPLAILRPRGKNDIKIAIKLAVELSISLVVRGSQVSHSAGGQAQSNGGLLLDFSTVCAIEPSGDGLSVRVGAGTMWNDVIDYSLGLGLMPPVVNDYQHLSVGGTISVGGVGFMSHMCGVQAGHVSEIEVLTGKGDVMHCSPKVNTDLFDLARGGLGQFGVLTSITLPLVQAPKQVITFKVFYSQSDGAKYFVNEVGHFVGMEVDMIHAFLKPSTRDCIAAIVGEEQFSKSPKEFQEAVHHGGCQNKVLYYLELGFYIWSNSENCSFIVEDLRAVMADMHFLGGVYFEEMHDFVNYLRRDPPVVETNKIHGKVPHPSFAVVVSMEATSSLLTRHLASDGRGDDSTNEILIIPVVSNRELKSGRDTPMFPLPTSNGDDDLFDNLCFFVLFLGSAIARDEQASLTKEIEKIRNHQRMLYEHARVMGGKRYSYDTITSEIRNEDEWKEHYGEITWKRIIAGKQKYDPYHIFHSAGVNMFN